MKKSFGIVCMLLLMTAILAVSAFAADLVPNDVFDKGTFTASDGTELPFRYYLPEGYDAGSGNYPVLLYMHGNGSRGSDNTTQLTNSAGEIVKLVLNSKYDCIIIAPQCPASPNQWVTDYPGGTKFAASLESGVYTADEYLNAAAELLNRFITKYRVDTKRIYITGCSNGGGATWSLVARHPNVFAAAVPFAGTRETAAVDTIASRYVGTPIWALHGDADATMSVAGTRAMVNAIQAAGGTIKYTEIAGGTHGFWVEAANTSGLVDWIFEQSNTDFSNTLPGAVDPNTTLVNTKVRKGADPWLFKHEDYYYLVMTGGTAIHCRKAKTISGLATASVRGLYSSLTDPTVEARFGKGAELSGTWSPEIYYFSEEEAPGNSGWYMYLALREATGDSSSIQMVVLKSTTDQPDGPYGHPVTGEKYHSQMILNEDGTRYSDWACGQGMLKIPTGPYKGLYTTWVTEIGRGQSGSAGNFYQQIKISKMKNPWTLTGTIGTVTEPTQEWEYVGSSDTHPRVVEGATAVYGKYGDVYITYSGSGYWSTYGLGQLTWNGGNPIKTESWVKLSDAGTSTWRNPIFTSRSVSFLTGAGHASFVADEEGNGFFCYHAYPSTSAGKINDPATGEPYRNAYIEPYYIDYTKDNGSGVANTGVIRLGYKKDRSPKDPDAIDIEMDFVTNGEVFKLEPATVTATPGKYITLSMFSEGAKEYTIYRKVDSGDYEQLAILEQTEYIDKDVKADKTYSYIVYASREEEIAAQSNVVSAKVEPRTLWDVLLVLRYVAGDTTGITKEKADINGDGTVNLWDALKTLRSTVNG